MYNQLGMRYFHLNKNKYYCPTINTNQLWSLLSERHRQAYKNATKKLEKVPVIDVTRAGYFKVLGKGIMPKIPIIVKAKLFSSKAEKKIKEVGGACVLIA